MPGQKPSSQTASALSGGVAHEINNPLTAVIANLDVALSDIAELAKHDPRCGAIEDRLTDARVAAERIHRMLRDIVSGKSSPTATDAEVAQQAATAAARRGRVLVVDDERLITTAVHRTLSLDHDVTALSDAQQALARLQSGERFDVILCDLMMPQMTGMELHSHLLEVAPDQAARMVFLTGGAFTSRAKAFLDQVPNVHIEKPFDTRSLRALINDRLR